MVQDQLTDYISSQIKLGVSREAIKSALVSAGWVAGDVEDTLKKVEGSAPSQPAARPITASPISVVTTKSSDPQMIRVSDLVSTPSNSGPSGSGSSSVSMSSSMSSSTKPVKDIAKVDASQLGGKIKGNSFEAVSSSSSSFSSSPKTGGSLIMKIVGGVLILAFAGLAWYFYSQNSGLAAQVATLNTESASVNSQLNTLQTAYTTSSTSDSAQIGNLTAANSDLALNLSFYAAPLGTIASSTAVTISGSLSGGGKALYAITTPRGAKIFIANSADPKIATQLKPLNAQTLQITGTYVPGSDQVTAVTIVDLSPPLPTAATSTATSTAPAAASTTTSTTVTAPAASSSAQ